MKENYLLGSSLAEKLYRDYAENLPIIDYHNHLSVLDLSKNKKFEDIFSIWLKSDPYKHRAMRICGVPEKFITGDAAPKEKFLKWAEVLPRLVGNPLYIWSQAELKRAFDINEPLPPASADKIWDAANEKLTTRDDLRAATFVKSFKAEYVAPCYGIADDLTPFNQIADFAAPSLRGDDMVAPTPAFIRKLELSANAEIRDLDTYLFTIAKRLAALNDAGARFSDHALDDGFKYIDDESGAKRAFSLIIADKTPDERDFTALKSHVFKRLLNYYKILGWTTQLHIGALRKTSDRLRSVAGLAGGYAAIGTNFSASEFTQMLNDIELSGGLPKLILFTLNPMYNAAVSVLSGSFTGENGSALISQGPAWWWCDHVSGMKEVFENMGAYGVLNEFVGMTTDSRSILSFTRHDYFRRVLCDFIAEKVTRGEFPDDRETLKNLIENTCYKNARRLIK